MFAPRNVKPGPALYYLTTPTRDHLPIFGLAHLASQVAPQLGRAAREDNAVVAGYCLLPSTLYAIVGFQGEYDLAGFMYNFKWLSSRAIFAQDHGEYHERLFRKDKFRPWMNRFDQMYIGTKEEFNAKLDYIHNEPVKRGLTAKPTEWEFSSARDWISGEQGRIPVAKEIPWLG
jgi:REP element-mobilizing transposase RayT